MASVYGFLDIIRVPGDSRSPSSVHPDAGRYTSSFFLNDLLVQPDVLPGVAESINVVCDRLGIRREDLTAFVYASPFCQAECHPAPDGRCVIRLSSALVESFVESELMFVIGHEIGHFLLGHLHQPSPTSDQDLEEIMIARRRELSVDRVGLLACDKLEVALSAMMKTISGLSSKHLNFNVVSFISQLPTFEKHGADGDQAYRSHPSFILRSRALLWFSMCRVPGEDHLVFDEKQIQRFNSRILKELERYVDKPLMEAINLCTEDYELWRVTAEIVKRGSFSKAMQQRFSARFGAEMTEKLKTMLSGLSTVEAVVQSEANLQQAYCTLQKVAPKHADMTVQRLASEVETIFLI